MLSVVRAMPQGLCGIGHVLVSREKKRSILRGGNWLTFDCMHSIALECVDVAISEQLSGRNNTMEGRA